MTTFNPTGDTQLASNNPGTNFGSDTYVQAGEWSGGVYTGRIAMKFDLSFIEPTATVTSATLRLYDDGSDLGTNARTMRVYRVLRNWVESQATWNSYSTGNAWGTAGCSNTTTDREASDIGSISMPQPEVVGYVEISLTAAKVQEWISGALANYGVLLQMDTETNDMHEFSSREAVANNPELVVTYTVPSAGGIIII